MARVSARRCGGFPEPRRVTPLHSAIALGWIAFTLFVWHFGIPAPYIGLMSLERVPQVGALLVFDAPAAVCLNAAASLIWPSSSASRC